MNLADLANFGALSSAHSGANRQANPVKTEDLEAGEKESDHGDDDDG